jgi:hypothetical protein
MLAASLSGWLSRHGIHYGWIMVALTFVTTVSTPEENCIGLAE